MHIIRNKEGDIIALSSKKEDAINIADKKWIKPIIFWKKYWIVYNLEKFTEFITEK